MTSEKLMERGSQQVRWGTSRGKVEIRILLLCAPHETTHPQKSTSASAACECCSPETKHSQPWLQSQLNGTREKILHLQYQLLVSQHLSCPLWRTGRLSVMDKHSWLSPARQHFQKSQNFEMNFAQSPGCHTCLLEVLHSCQYTTGYAVVNTCIC